jgi:transcriptional/translational regulatory protein YebC/TACO1
MGESGSVAYMFDRVGLIEYTKDKISDDAMFEAGLEAGADNVDSSGDVHEITCKPDDFAAVRDALQAKFGDAHKATLAWKPNLNIDVTDEEVAKTLLNLIEALEDNDDVQTVTANFNIADTILEKLAG